MFGKVQEDSFQSIFDLSLDNVMLNGESTDGTFERRNKGIVGVRQNSPSFENSSRDSVSPSLVASLLQSSSALNLQTTGRNNDPWSTNNSLVPAKLEEKDVDQLQSSAYTSTFFSASQLEQLQKLQQLSFNEKQQLANFFTLSKDIPSTSDLVNKQDHQQQPQQKLNHHSNTNQTPFLFDHHNDSTSCSSASSSASSSSSDTSISPGTNSKVNTSRYKTEMCRPFQENGSCKYGEKCQFAHGFGELRIVTRHPKYKTDLCRTYHSSGFCPYGPRCHFVHNLEEASSQQQHPVNVNNRPGQSASPQSPIGSISNKSPMNSPVASCKDSDKTEVGVQPLPMFSRHRNNAPQKPFLGRQNDGNNVALNFELKLNTANTHKLPSYLNVSSGEGSVASLSPVTPVSSDNVGTFNGDNARSPTRLPVFSTLFD